MTDDVKAMLWDLRGEGETVERAEGRAVQVQVRMERAVAYGSVMIAAWEMEVLSMVHGESKEELFARIAAARRDGRENIVPAEQAARYTGRSKPAQQAAFMRKVRRPKPSALHVWKVDCPGNERLTTLVTAPIKPQFCPTCGGRSPRVIEIEPPAY